MDFLTNSLVGFALARSGLAKFSVHGTLLLFCSINLPDIDSLARLHSDLLFLEQHGGYTHTLLALPLLALLPVLLIAAFRRPRPPARFSWSRAWLLCGVGVAIHLLLDWFTSYGLRPLLPFSPAWHHLDFIEQLDPYLLTALALAAIWPFFSKLVSAEIGGRSTRGRGSARAALIFLIAFLAARAVAHRQAMQQMEARLFDGAPPIRLAALPDGTNPLHWTGVVETADGYHTVPVSLTRSFDSEAGVSYFKAAITPSMQRAQATQEFRYFQYFAQFPVWSTVPVLLEAGEGNRLQLTDLRFGSPVADGPACFALEDTAGHLLRSWFTLHATRGAQP